MHFTLLLAEYARKYRGLQDSLLYIADIQAHLAPCACWCPDACNMSTVVVLRVGLQMCLRMFVRVHIYREYDARLFLMALLILHSSFLRGTQPHSFFNTLLLEYLLVFFMASFTICMQMCMSTETYVDAETCAKRDTGVLDFLHNYLYARMRIHSCLTCVYANVDLSVFEKRLRFMPTKRKPAHAYSRVRAHVYSIHPCTQCATQVHTHR